MTETTVSQPAPPDSASQPPASQPPTSQPVANLGTDDARELLAGQRSLAGIKLLAEVPPERLVSLADACTWKSFAPNDVIFELADTSTDVYFITRGKLRIIVFTGAAESCDDPDALAKGIADGTVILAEMMTGDTFGELAGVDGRPRSARALALDNCTVAILPREAFLSLLEDCPKVTVALLQRFASLIRSLNKRVFSLSTLTPIQRIYVELVRLAEPNPQGDGNWLITQLPPHGDIAAWAGADREHVAQAIGALAREGIVERRHRSLYIKNHARLRLLAHM